MLGDFAILHGSLATSSMSTLLCVRAQLPYQLGGLETNVVFVDGGNSFRLYDISTVAQLHDLDPRKVLGRIFISRAFTAYQLTSLVFEKLQDAIENHNSKLVILSNLAQLYLDKDVPNREAKEVFIQLTEYISKFAKRNRVIVVVTYPPHYPSKRNKFFKEVVCGRANVVASVKPSKNGRQFILAKHPFFTLGQADFPSENLMLIHFMET